MIQLYFLSILICWVGGLLLACKELGERFTVFERISSFFNWPPRAGFIFGIVAVLIGLLKFISVSGGGLPILGDFLPAMGSLLVGISLIIEYINENGNDRCVSSPKFMDFFLNFKVPIGIGSILAGALHFFLPLAPLF